MNLVIYIYSDYSNSIHDRHEYIGLLDVPKLEGDFLTFQYQEENTVWRVYVKVEDIASYHVQY